MPQFLVSATLRQQLAAAVELPDVAAVRADMYRDVLASPDGVIEWAVARALARDLRVPVHRLLRGCDVCAPAPFQAPRAAQSQETKAMFDAMRRERDDRSYRRLVANVVDPMVDDPLLNRREIRSFRDHIGVNIIVTRLVLLVVGWWIGHKSLGGMWGPVVGVVFMVIGFLAEIGVYVIKADRLNQSIAQHEQRDRETFPGSIAAVKPPSIEAKKRLALQ